MLAFALAVLILARAPADTAPCNRQHPPSGARLQAIVRELHPEALQPAADGATTIVGVVLDSACTVQRHGMTTRSGGTITVDTTLAEMFPAVHASPFVISGIARLDGTARDRTVVVWAVTSSQTK